MISGFYALLRSIGLSALYTLYTHSWAHQNLAEEKKPIVVVSLWTALQRCMVHLLPSITSIALIALNFRGFFIGFQLAGIPDHDSIDMAALQVAAKLQELLIVASIAAIVFHRLRHDLLSTRGIPFGALSSGLSFTQISHFWSPEFIAAVSCWPPLPLFSLIIVGGLIAATAGPATAVLVIPRQLSYPAGSATYFVNGTKDMLWPSHIRLSHYLFDYNNSGGENVSCSNHRGYLNALCPSGGFSSLLHHFSASTLLNDVGVPLTTYAGWGTFSQSPKGGIVVQSVLGQVPPQLVSGIILRPGTTETIATTAHGATTALQHRLNFDWYLAVQSGHSYYADSNQRSRLKYYATQETTVDSQMPAVRVVCQGQTLAANAAQALFPVMPASEPAVNQQANILATRLVSLQSEIHPLLKNTSKFQWVDIRPAFLGNESIAVSVGALVKASSQDDGRQLIAACSIDARWATAKVSSQYPGPFRASPLQKVSFPKHTGFLSGEEWFLFRNELSTQISFDATFLDAINFQVPPFAHGIRANGTSAIEAIIDAAGVVTKSAEWIQAQESSSSLHYLEFIIASILADGISRAGSYRNYDTTGPVESWRLLFYNSSRQSADIAHWNAASVEPTDTANLTRLRMKQSVTGYGYQADNVSDYLAITVLLVHLLLASAHVIYLLGISRGSSGCWDTFSEVVALAQQSAPASHVLRNTCTGIERLGTFKTRVRIGKASRNPSLLEFQFADDMDKSAEVTSPEDMYGD